MPAVTALVSDTSDYVVCPWSALLSAAGSIAFQNRVSHIEAAAFKAPELLREPRRDEPLDMSQVRPPRVSVPCPLYPPSQPAALPMQSRFEDFCSWASVLRQAWVTFSEPSFLHRPM